MLGGQAVEEGQRLQRSFPFPNLDKVGRRFRKTKQAAGENQSEDDLYAAGNSIRARVCVLTCRVIDHGRNDQAQILDIPRVNGSSFGNVHQ